MPKTQRDLYRRKLAQAYININWAATYLLELYNVFNPVHPELGAYLQGALEGLAVNTEILTQFAQDAWGKETPDWIAWAATGKPTHGTFIHPDENPDNNTIEEPLPRINADEDKADEP